MYAKKKKKDKIGKIAAYKKARQERVVVIFDTNNLKVMDANYK